MRVFLLVLLAAAVGSGLGLASRRLFREKSVATVASPSAVVSKPASVAVPSPSSDVLQQPHPVGYVVGRGRVQVVMSDGTTRTERDPELGVLQRNSVVIDGKKHFIRPAVSAVVATPSASPVASAPVEHVNTQELRSQAGGGSWLPPDGYGVSRLRDSQTLSASK